MQNRGVMLGDGASEACCNMLHFFFPALQVYPLKGLGGCPMPCVELGFHALPESP